MGATKNSYTAGYFYMQNCEDETPCPLFSAIEVFHENHADDLAEGDIVQVQGYVTDDGATILNACSYQKIGKSISPIEPLQLTTADFPLPFHEVTNAFETSCNEEAEGLEHMLVTIMDPIVQCCSDAHGYSDNSSYADRCQGNFNGTWAQVWDVYKQFYITTAGYNGTLLDVDNHMYSVFTDYYTRCEDDYNSADQWVSLTGIVGWQNGFSNREQPRWEISPRNEFDVIGATYYELPNGTMHISQIKNALEPQWRFGSDYDTVPVNLIGTLEVNSLGQQGTGCDGVDGFDEGSCPRTDRRLNCNFYPHAICNCYPLDTYSSTLSSGTQYFWYEGVVNHVQDPTGPFYFESDCGVGNGLYVYRNDAAAETLDVGDKIRILARVYHYYGLDELSDPITIEVVSKNNPLCPPAEITAASFQSEGHGDCVREADVIEGSRVEMRNVEVTRIFNAACMDGENITWAANWTSQWCPDECNGRCWGAYLQGYFDGALSAVSNDTYTAIEIMDQQGNKMVLDQAGSDQTAKPLTPLYLGTVPGKEGETLKVGDTFERIVGFVDHRRGSYSLEYGGYYAFIVKEIIGWNEQVDPLNFCKERIESWTESIDHLKAAIQDLESSVAFCQNFEATFGG